MQGDTTVSETSPNPTTPPPSQPSQPSSGPVLPPIDLRALVATALAVVKSPAEFFRGIKDEIGFVKCLVFSVAAAVVYGGLVFFSSFFLGLRIGFVSAIGTAFTELIKGVIVGGIVGPFLGGLIVWGVSLVFGSKAPYEPSVRIAAYSSALLPAVGLASFIVGLSFIFWIVTLAILAYGIYIAVTGAKILNFDAPPAPTTGA